MRYLTALLAIVALLASGPAQTKPLTFSVEQVFVDEDNRDLRRVGELEFISGISITSDNKHFGGLSDLHVSEDGQMIAITDKGYRVRTRLQHDRDGDLTGLLDGDIVKLQTTKGKKLKGKKKSDAEGLIRTNDGWYVSFEHKQRIWFYPGVDPANVAATKVSAPKGLKDMPANGGLESLVELSDGRLLTFSEGLENASGQTQGWLRTGEVWENIYLSRPDDFAPTGMTRLASGDILVLERSYSLLKGPAARVRLIELNNIKTDAVLAGREIARLSGSQTVDNMEGINAVMTPAGERIYLISDDNFNPMQRNLIFMFRFAE
jgi:hypothetical protein